MSKNYRSSNVRFDMDDPIQRRAWDLLQAKKGSVSYGKIIADALVNMQSCDKVELSDRTIDSIVKRMEQVLDNRKLMTDMTPPCQGQSDSSKDITADMLAFAFD